MNRRRRQKFLRDAEFLERKRDVILIRKITKKPQPPPHLPKFTIIRNTYLLTP